MDFREFLRRRYMPNDPQCQCGCETCALNASRVAELTEEVAALRTARPAIVYIPGDKAADEIVERLRKSPKRKSLFVSEETPTDVDPLEWEKRLELIRKLAEPDSLDWWDFQRAMLQAQQDIVEDQLAENRVGMELFLAGVDPQPSVPGNYTDWVRCLQPGDEVLIVQEGPNQTAAVRRITDKQMIVGGFRFYRIGHRAGTQIGGTRFLSCADHPVADRPQENAK